MVLFGDFPVPCALRRAPFLTYPNIPIGAKSPLVFYLPLPFVDGNTKGDPPHSKMVLPPPHPCPSLGGQASPPPEGGEEIILVRLGRIHEWG